MSPFIHKGNDMIEIYKKKPVSVAVLAWDGRNFDEIKKFAGDIGY